MWGRKRGSSNVDQKEALHEVKGAYEEHSIHRFLQTTYFYLVVFERKQIYVIDEEEVRSFCVIVRTVSNRERLY